MEATNKIIQLAISTKDNPSVNRSLQRGLNAYTEQYAYPYIIPLAGESLDEKLALQLAGLVASHIRLIPQNDDISFGEFVKISEKPISGNSDKDKKGDYENTLLQLSNLPLEQAIETLHRLLTRIENNSKTHLTGFNWYRLGKTLSRWGKGVSDKSLQSRQSILKEYYRIASKKEETHEPNNKGNE